MQIPPSLADHAAQRIEQLILGGQLKPGQPVREQDIAGALDISRPPIREAFKLLEGEGLLIRRPRRGVYVVNLTSHDVWEIYTLKASLFCTSVELAMQKQDKGWVAQLKKPLAGMEKCALSSSPDVIGYQKNHDLFHNIIMQRAGNLRLLNLVKRLHKPVTLISRKSLSNIDHLRDSYEYHVRIYEAIKAQDKDLAVSLMHDHVVNTLEGIMKIMEEDIITDGLEEDNRQKVAATY